MDCQNFAGDVISWVIGLLNYNVRQSITLLKLPRDVGKGVPRNPRTSNPPRTMMIPQ